MKTRLYDLLDRYESLECECPSKLCDVCTKYIYYDKYLQRRVNLFMGQFIPSLESNTIHTHDTFPFP